VLRMREEVCGAPEQPHTGRFLALGRLLDHRPQPLLAVRDAGALRREITIMEAIERHAELREELERGVEAILGALELVASLVPWIDARPRPERIGSRAVERMPVADGEAQMLAHRPAAHDPILVIR